MSSFTSLPNFFVFLVEKLTALIILIIRVEMIFWQLWNREKIIFEEKIIRVEIENSHIGGKFVNIRLKINFF